MDEVKSGRIGANMGLTLNLGNYESIRLDVSQEATYTGRPGDDRDTVFAALVEDCRTKLYESLVDEIRTFRGMRKAIVSS